jgi:catechol 2,3-dioxygenase-like lactoylglutathione lyase family enzyme
MKKRDGEPWMDAADYGRSLSGFGVNLLVPDIDAALAFQTKVLEAEVVYADADFAVLDGYGASWMLHADHTYRDHPLFGSLADTPVRGIGCELRLHRCDPDAAEARARDLGYTVLAGAMDKPHGLREAYILDADGYLWVPDTPIGP